MGKNETEDTPRPSMVLRNGKRIADRPMKKADPQSGGEEEEESRTVRFDDPDGEKPDSSSWGWNGMAAIFFCLGCLSFLVLSLVLSLHEDRIDALIPREWEGVRIALRLLSDTLLDCHRMLSSSVDKLLRGMGQ